jgi:hypothetical protein
MVNRRVHPARQVRRTALLVGEGLAEEVFLKHLKAIYVERGGKTEDDRWSCEEPL